MLIVRILTYGKHEKFVEHKRGVSVSRSNKEQHSNFLSVLQTSHNSILHCLVTKYGPNGIKQVSQTVRITHIRNWFENAVVLYSKMI